MQPLLLRHSCLSKNGVEPGSEKKRVESPFSYFTSRWRLFVRALHHLEFPFFEAVIGCSFSLREKSAYPAASAFCIQCRRREKKSPRQRSQVICNVSYGVISRGPSSALTAFFSSWAISRFFVRNFLPDLDKWRAGEHGWLFSSALSYWLAFWFDACYVWDLHYSLWNCHISLPSYECPTKRCYFLKR